MKVVANNLPTQNAQTNDLKAIKMPMIGRLSIIQQGKVTLVKISEINYCQAEGNYTRISLKSGKMILASKCLKHILADLPQTHFCRIHQSFVVNLYTVESVTRDEVCLFDDTKLPLSRARKKSVLSYFNISNL